MRLHVLSLGAVLLATAGCTHAVHVNHTSDFRTTKPLSEYREVRSSAEQTVILGIIGQTNYADEAYEELMRQCQMGSVTGIQTRLSTSHNFFHWRNEVKMKGYCSE